MKRIFLFSFLLTLLLGGVSSCSSDEENQQEPERPLYPTSPVTILSAEQISCEKTTDSYHFKVSIVASCDVELDDWGVAVYSNSKIQKTVSVGTPNKTGSYEFNPEIEVPAAYMDEEKTLAVPMFDYYAIPYVRYGDEKILDREKKVKLELKYTACGCPDDHHPHAIDLGLPSGTKWCCCNVGASTPEGYGGYYAWGETSEKGVYNEVTYRYCTGTDTDGDGWYERNTSYQNIGSDIAGTQYDVAHVRMGGSWRMPTHEQQMELKQYCSCQWTQQNGVRGILVTGPNGGQVFLPAAGYRWGDILFDDGSYGYYWSSSVNPYDDGAYGLVFYSGYWDWGYGGRYGGHSVRGVSH